MPKQQIKVLTANQQIKVSADDVVTLLNYVYDAEFESLSANDPVVLAYMRSFDSLGKIKWIKAKTERRAAA